MAMNKYMHPRNIYKVPPDFKQLAILYPEFRKYLKQDISGKVSLDFKDVNALRALSRALLLRDFDLNVDIPVNKLIPTIPLRLNYLLWIEDLLNIKKSELAEVYGIDIGTGASCIYPLIAAKKFKWYMIATENDVESIQYAKKNVSQNLLDDKITIVDSVGSTLLYEIISDMNKTFKFCMCNPPFFSSTQELHPFFKSRKLNRPRPKNAFCASVNEVVVSGGEVEFISKLIRESVELKSKIEIFTTMIGHKSSLNPLKTLLREVGICSFKQTEFCQGCTTRWGLAWTFCDIDLRTIPNIIRESKVKSKPPLTYIIPEVENKCTFEDINNEIQRLARELKLEIHEYKKNKTCIIYDIKAYANTWSNQRRKRRENLKIAETVQILDTPNEKSINDMFSGPHDLDKNSLGKIESINNESVCDLQNASLKLSEMEIASTTPKREYEDEDEYYCNKKFKENNTVINNNYVAKFFISIKKGNSQLVVELFSLNYAETSRETIHQILQYIKNNINLSL